MSNNDAIYMTVEYHDERGLKVISNEYPKTLVDCAAAVERLKDCQPLRKYGIVKLVELKPVQRPTIVTDWIESQKG